MRGMGGVKKSIHQSWLAKGLGLRLLCWGCRYEIIEEMKEAVTKVIDTLTQEDFHWAFQKLLERYNNRLQPEEITSKGSLVSRVYYQ